MNSAVRHTGALKKFAIEGLSPFPYIYKHLLLLLPLLLIWQLRSAMRVQNMWGSLKAWGEDKVPQTGISKIFSPSITFERTDRCLRI